jgi:hypothetical protein
MVSGVSARKLSVLDRFGTPLWIAVGLSIIGLAILAALG